MACGKFVLRPNVEHGDLAILETAREFLSGYRFHRVALAKIAADRFPNLGQIALGDMMQRGCQSEHGRIAEAIIDVLAGTPRRQQAGAAHQTQVLRSIGNRQSCPVGQGLHGTLALRQQFENFEPVTVAERLGDIGELSVENLLWAFA